MTQKRYTKLLRAFFTRFNEDVVKNGYGPLDLKVIYKYIEKPPASMTRQEWCDQAHHMFEEYNVGVKSK